MNKKFHPYQIVKQFPLQQLQKFIQHQNMTKKRLIPKQNIIINKSIKSHSKSLYYHKNINLNAKTNDLRKYQKNLINNTKLQQSYQNDNYKIYTINQQILCPQQKKPSTQQCRSGRNTNEYKNIKSINGNCINNNLNSVNNINNFDTKNNRISLRSSSHYTKLTSIAGIPINQKFGQQRKQNYLNTKDNIRKIKYRQIQKQNQRLAKRLDGSQSNYSTKKILKSYQLQQKISKRLTQSKLSQRSNQSKRTSLSQKSDRSSVYSKSSRNSSRSSLKSTQRSAKGFINSNNSNNNNIVNRFNRKLNNNNNKVKIIQHNINNANQQQVNKFRSLFANSFTSAQKPPSNNYLHYKLKPTSSTSTKKHQPHLLKQNPYVDIQILSQKSSTNQSKKNINKSFNLISTSNKKLSSQQYQQQKNKISNSVMPSFGNLLHKIAEEMYCKDYQNEENVQNNKIMAMKYKKNGKPNSHKNNRNLVQKQQQYVQPTSKYSIFSMNNQIKI